jgi:hypothetical protein
VRFSVHRTEAIRKSSFGAAAQQLIARGYSCDFISDRQLGEARVEQGAIATSSAGGRYLALIVPQCTAMPLETAKKLRDLAAGGAHVLFLGLPHEVPGLAQHTERTAELKEIVKGFVSAGAIDEVALERADVRREPMSDKGLAFIRRSVDGGHAYFVANLTGAAVDAPIALATPSKSIAMMDPLTGVIGGAQMEDNAIRIQLDPGESIIIRTSRDQQLPPWQYRAFAGDSVALGGTWDVAFVDGGPTLPAPLKLDKLDSWTERGDDAAKAFSGTARYRLEFDAPSSPIAKDWLLDLGDVRETARVTLNGKPAGTFWSLPFRARVGEHLKPGRNVLEVEVTNLAANRVRDLDRRKVEWRIMKEINFVNINYRPFDAASWPLAPSGLLGPVTLTPLR